MRDPARYYRDNVAGGVALLEAARAAGVTRLVFSSTAAVYGVPDRTPIEEDDPLRPINTYGETKRTFEGALRWYGEAYGFRSVILRYFNVAGASARLGEVHRPETHLIPNMLAAAEGGAPLTLFGDDYPTPDGTPIRDYIHVEDLADAHVAALLATDPGSGTPLVCNLGTSTGFSVREVLASAARIVGREIPHTVGPQAGRRPARPRGVERPGPRDARLVAAPLDARRDARLGLGVAPGEPGRLRGLRLSPGRRAARGRATGAAAARRNPDRAHGARRSPPSGR